MRAVNVAESCAIFRMERPEASEFSLAFLHKADYN